MNGTYNCVTSGIYCTKPKTDQSKEGEKLEVIDTFAYL